MISTWMEKLINMRKPRSAFLSIISFTFYFFAGVTTAPAQNLWETNPLDIKHYSSNIAVHLNAVSEADQKISWVSEASRYVTLSDLLEVVSAMDDYSTAEKIGDFLQSHDQIFPTLMTISFQLLLVFYGNHISLAVDFRRNCNQSTS